MIVDGNNFISHYLKNNISFCAGKIGVTELNILYFTEVLKFSDSNYANILKHEVEDIAGMYPFNNLTSSKFTNDMFSALKLVDLIPKWSKVLPQYEDYVFKTYSSAAYITNLQHLEAYFFEKPWTKYLENKRVLVFSPFAESITNNFNKLNLIWKDKIVPNFQLKAIKYPFAIKITENSEYVASDEIYNKYIKILNDEKDNFDVGIFGTGYTSLLFAAECKRLGKTGIHLGGSTQILFGIKGQRWRENNQFHSFFNEHWTDPLPHERPQRLNLVEGGCYW
jgi:hypothetical protein